ncbi:MAG: bis(5'-nucleosyl)-tetraphosphatase (symmetrical) [Gammaproteobacteria bacterium 28-57-27]|nr:MAG: bis(5'-nucleosyl)-tetraphosphatase (symmetrical) [Gammaproteobacteria bacterium 28-57-27]
MPTYVIGDLQGCLDPLKRLLDQIQFNYDQDKLWFVGDVVNRGPQSLETLRFVRELEHCSITVLGNHDLHLLAVAYTGKKSKGKDTLGDILHAPDREELLDWLRKRPLLHHEPSLAALLVHAGIPPAWDIETSLARAHEVEQVLGSNHAAELLSIMYNDQPDRWRNDMTQSERLIYSINAFTRMRYFKPDGRMEFKNKGAPAQSPAQLIPWYDMPRQPLGARVFFGHWSTLGQIRLPKHTVEALAMDSGCLWGGRLSTIQVDDPDLPMYSVACAETVKPGIE